MLSKMISSRLLVVLVLTIGWTGPNLEAGSACVWKVSAPNGAMLYLGGSIHALKSSDYPLPAAYNRAFDASTRLVFEDDPKDSSGEARIFSKESEYSKGDSLKKHVDPRTYDYVRRVFKLMGVPEEKFSKYRPWALVLWLQSPAMHGLSGKLGVEGFMLGRARATSKPVSGLESPREHIQVFSGLTERQSEALLLVTFIPKADGKESLSKMVDNWRHGDAETVTRSTYEEFRDFPAMGERLLAARNRNWIPKIEGYLHSGQSYFVIAGAAHMGGPDGVVALLRSRGYQIEQL